MSCTGTRECPAPRAGRCLCVGNRRYDRRLGGSVSTQSRPTVTQSGWADDPGTLPDTHRGSPVAPGTDGESRLHEYTVFLPGTDLQVEGRPFDLRVCLRHMDESNLLSGSDVFEELVFREAGPVGFEHPVELTVERSGRLDGFLLWIELDIGGGQVVGSLRQATNWLPVFFPAFYPGWELRQVTASRPYAAAS